MTDIVVNSAFPAIIYIPESAAGNTVTYAIYKASDGSTFASGSMTFLAGRSWKVSFTPASIDKYILEWNNTTLDRQGQEVYRVLGEVEAVTPDADYTFDISTNLGKVRALIGDTDATAVLLTNAKINAFLAMVANNLYQAASIALNAIAANKGLLAKKITAGNYSEDASSMAKEFRELAKVYNDLALAVPAEAQAEQFFTDFSYRDLLAAKTLREETT